jgi:hypothetical protein
MLRLVWKLQNIKCGIICQSGLNNNDYVGAMFRHLHLRAEFGGVRRSVLWFINRFDVRGKL